MQRYFKRRAPKSVLTEEQIKALRDPKNDNVPAREFALSWNVSAETIRRARRGDTFNWLPQDSELAEEVAMPKGRDPSPEEIAKSLERFKALMEGKEPPPLTEIPPDPNIPLTEKAKEMIKRYRGK